MIKKLNQQKGILFVSLFALMLSFLGDSPWMEKLQYSLHYYRFERDLERKEEAAEAALNRMVSTLSTGGVSAIRKSSSWIDLTQEEDISFFILEKGKQLYWTDPLVDMETIKYPVKSSVLIRLKNRLALYSIVTYKDYQCMALIKIRDMFPNTNELLQNDFARQFDLPLAAKLVVKPSDKQYPLFNQKGEYLFSLSFSDMHSQGSWMQYMSVFFFILFLVCVFILSKRVIVHPYAKAFVPLLLLCFFYGLGWPGSVFEMELFSPHTYASDFLFRSLGDLFFLILTISYIAGIATYWLRQKKIGISSFKGSVFCLVGCFLFFLFMLCGMILLQKDLIINSSFVVIPEKLTGVSGYTICTYLIYFGIIFSLCEIYRTVVRMVKDRISAGFLFLIKIGFLVPAVLLIVPIGLYPVSVLGWFFLLSAIVDFSVYGDRRFSFPVRFVVLPLFFSLFIADFSSGFSKERLEDKMSAVAENMALGLGRDFDPYAQMLLKEIDAKLKQDTILGQMVDMEEDETEIVSYLRREYFGGFFHSYRLNVYNCDDDQSIDLPQGSYNCKEHYDRFKSIHCKPLPETRFYYHKNRSLPGYLIQTDYSFTTLYIELTAQPGSKAYRYSALLTDTSNPGESEWFSTARYYKGKLMMQTGDYEYPFTDEWRVAAGDNISLVMPSGGYIHYVYRYGTDYSIVVSESDKQLKSRATMITFVYLMFLLLLMIVFVIYRILKRERLYPSTLQSRFQRWFTFILLISCAATGFFSIWFYATLNYSEQVQLLVSKTTMIKKQIETMNTTSNGLNQMLSKPDFFLQEMSARNEVDILLYSPDGKLLGSFSPILLNKGLIGRWMSPLALSDLQSHQSEVILQEHTGRLEYVSCYMSIRDKNNETIAFLNLPWYVSTHKMEEEVSNFVLILLNIYMIIILLVMLANYFIIRRIAHPLQMIGVGLNQVGLHSENLPMSYKYNDEIGQLVNRYNQMLVKLEESADLLAKSERESAWKEMARQVAHEINNPLTPMRLTIQQLAIRREKSPDTFDAYLSKASITLIEQIDALSAIATEFSKFARLPGGVLQPMDLRLCIENVVHLFKSHKDQVDIYTDFQDNQSIIISGDKEQLTRVFNNLIKNAIQAIDSSQRGVIRISAQIDSPRVCITISDNGTGVPKELREKLFTPNFTTKSSGMGLGLTIIKHHVEQSGGKIKYSPLDQGSSFIVEFPLIELLPK